MGGPRTQSDLNERWLPVANYEGLYAISDFGRVRSLPRLDRMGRRNGGRYLRPTANVRWGYLTVPLWKSGKAKRVPVHLLVLKAFVGPRPLGMVARHFPDRDKRNNRLSNLSWGTSVENHMDAVIHGTFLRGELHPNAKNTVAEIIEIRSLAEHGVPQRRIAEQFNLSEQTVSRIVRRERWAHV